jgi:hypothetical protein
MKLTIFSALAFAVFFSYCRCSKPTPQVENQKPDDKLSQQELVARGRYLATIGGCNDCHSPKVMTPAGPAPDSTRLLSGHPSQDKISSIIKTQDWILFNNGTTAFVGPWGLSYAANLTPDETGIGNWNYDQFVTAMRKGKSKGLESNRLLLPPMPWQMYRHMTDDDLQAIYTYLKSLPPVDNLVPPPVAPGKLLSQSN